MLHFNVKVRLENLPSDEELEKMSIDEAAMLCLDNNWFLPMDKINGLKVNPKDWIKLIKEYNVKPFPTMEDLNEMDEEKMKLFSYVKGWVYPWEINYFCMSYKVKFDPKQYLDEIMKEFGDGNGNIDKERLDEFMSGDKQARLDFIENVIKNCPKE